LERQQLQDYFHLNGSVGKANVEMVSLQTGIPAAVVRNKFKALQQKRCRAATAAPSSNTALDLNEISVSSSGHVCPVLLVQLIRSLIYQS